jgi:bacteriorhodopsin
MSTAVPYPTQLGFEGGRRIARWRPPVQWLLAIPHLLIASALVSLRSVLTLVTFFTVLFTKQIPRSIFDVIAMTYRYEWRVTSYALFLRENYPPFDFQPAADDDGVDPYTVVTLTYPEVLNRWMPLYKWFLAIPRYAVLLGLLVAAAFVIVAGFVAVVSSGEYPVRLRNFLVGVYRYNLRLQAYVGLLNDQYPPFAVSS